MDIIKKFINVNASALRDIYIKHEDENSNKEGSGVLFIELLKEKNNVNVNYIPFDLITDELDSFNRQKLINNKPLHAIYFLVEDNKKTLMIELDLKEIKE